MRRTMMLVMLAATPLLAQQQQAKDATNKVEGAAVPAGWMVRLDDDATRDGLKPTDTKFITMGRGFHVTSGPAALYYNPADQAKGAFTASASFGQRKAPEHPEAYGLFIGGSKLSGAEQQYFYFLVRGDGKYYVAHRAGGEVHRIVAWTEHSAIVKQNDAGAATNVLAMQVTADSVHLLANGQRVKSFAKTEMHGFNTDGQVGLRVNHNLDVHIGSYEVKK